MCEPGRFAGTHVIIILIVLIRVPESLFLGADVVVKMSEEELEEMGWTVLVFVSSILLERLTHLVMEVGGEGELRKRKRGGGGIKEEEKRGRGN